MIFQWKIVSAERAGRKDRAGRVVYYIRSDHIGRPVFATNAAGVQVWSASYLPFGGVRTATGTPIILRFPPLAHLADALPGNGRVVPILARGSSRGRVFLRRRHRNLVCEGTAIRAYNF